MATIVIAGRPNVGKSTLFNRLYGRRHSITDHTPGVTRDVIRADIRFAGVPVTLVDTGGIGEGERDLATVVSDRSRYEIQTADLVFLMLDALDVTGEDEELIDFVRRAGRPTICVVNKVDNPRRQESVGEFYRFGFERVVAISAEHGLGIDELEEAAKPYLAAAAADPEAAGADPSPSADSSADAGLIRLAIVGKPNTGKSSLLNRLVGRDRAIVSELAGTTRDPVEDRFEYRGERFLVIDTAGIRKKSRVSEAIEYYSVTRALDAVERSELVIMVIDVISGLTEQDKKIAQRIVDRGRAVVVVLNKWDLLDDRANQLNAITDRINFLFPVFEHVPMLPVSAVTGEGIDKVLAALLQIRREIHLRIETGQLNQALQRWLARTPPPSGKRPIKLRYITQVGTNPVRFVLFVNRAKGFPEFYLRYIQNQIRKELGFAHIPLFVEVRE